MASRGIPALFDAEGLLPRARSVGFAPLDTAEEKTPENNNGHFFMLNYNMDRDFVRCPEGVLPQSRSFINSRPKSSYTLETAGKKVFEMGGAR